MNSLELMSQFRKDIDDVADPKLWSDGEVAYYANDAQRMFCRLTNGISDSSSLVCELDVTVGQVEFDLHPSIMRIRRAARVSDGRPLQIMNIDDVDKMGYRLNKRSGPVHGMIIGMDEQIGRWDAVPSIKDTVMLTVFRLPLNTIKPFDPTIPEADQKKVQLEIPEQHHWHLLMWMKHLAYGRQDSDTYDARKADINERAFRAYCLQAKIEQDNTRRVARSIAYGGL